MDNRKAGAMELQGVEGGISGQSINTWTGRAKSSCAEQSTKKLCNKRELGLTHLERVQGAVVFCKNLSIKQQCECQ